jgi:hypothetical protein
LFYATAGKIFTERSRTTSLLAALNVLYPDIQQLDEEKQNYIVLCFCRYSLLQQTALGEKKQNHITLGCSPALIHCTAGENPARRSKTTSLRLLRACF